MKDGLKRGTRWESNYIGVFLPEGAKDTLRTFAAAQNRDLSKLVRTILAAYTEFQSVRDAVREATVLQMRDEEAVKNTGEHMAEIGKLGGLSRSRAKRTAARINGAKRGRPRGSRRRMPVRRGETIAVLDRETPAAESVPLPERGTFRVLKPAPGSPAPNRVPLPEPLTVDVDVVDLLLEERQSPR